MKKQLKLNDIESEKLDKVRCEVCDREFEEITWSHLKNHDMTLDEYMEQFSYALVVSEGKRQKNREARLGKKASEETKQKSREAHLGKPSGMKGKHQSEATRQLMRDSSPHIHGENHCCFGKRGKETSMFGKHQSEESKQKSRESQLGEKNHRWLGGISNLPYCIKFNDDLKERVRNFFNRCCYVCGKNEIDNGQKLDVHHVNYDKMVCCNDVKPLFVPLCRSCHSKTLKDREYWEEFFTVSLEYLTNSECFLEKGDKRK